MEVHHHPHVEKRSFKEYFLEFIMIFLAVTMGFFAESIRENISDGGKEREYMVTMLEDLKKDTLAFDKVMATNKFLIRGEDSALNFLMADLNIQANAETALIYFYKYCVNLSFVQISNGTITQLKNNGGMRLIKNAGVMDHINAYYNDISALNGQESSINEFLSENDKKAGEVFDYMSNKAFIDSTYLSDANPPSTLMRRWLTHRMPVMLTTERKTLGPFMNNIGFHAGLMMTYILLMEDEKKRAIALIGAIRSNYHLEND